MTISFSKLRGDEVSEILARVQDRVADADPVSSRLTFSADNFSVPKEAGKGVLIAGQHAWGDLIGDVNPKNTGAGSATLALWHAGLYRAWFYAAGDLCDMLFHLPHDYVPGTDIFLHLHWGHHGTAISGSLLVTFGVSVAKGHNQTEFSAEKSPTLTVLTPNIATVPRYRHRIDEIQLSSKTPSATQLNTKDLEVDGLLLIGLRVDVIPTITGGSTNKPAFFTLDIHYQSTGIGTINKSPNFYGDKVF